MKDINIRDIIDLATQEVADPDSELKKVYEWHHERKIMIIKGTISIAISLIISLTISYFKSELKLDKWSMLYPLGFALLSMTYGFYELYRVRSVGRKYIAAITLLNRFKKITPFLNLYRRTLRNQ
ncbi:hypothetical protein ACE1ET_20350 [Saccharicrinis sp. FJH62]|uniref:hypothetical protein n=1 Tax=Saccharicrinis sp. FJH62 TaxID=3344657 RepID=UPI0035D41710